MKSKSTLKNNFQIIKSMCSWELKSNSSALAAYSILVAVILTVALIFVLEVLGEIDSVYDFSLPANMTLQQKMSAFQFISVIVISIIGAVFSLLFMGLMFGYMHNKRQTDLYLSMPISRNLIYVSHLINAYLFTVVPALFFMGLCSIISICTGTMILKSVVTIGINFIIGSLALISAYSFIAICCGSSIISFVVLILISITYPIATSFIVAFFDSFFAGVYTGVLRETFLIVALNPFCAFFGKHQIYWIVFSVVCVFVSMFLNKRRKNEAAQTTFAIYFPCHLVKIIVSFIVGTFLGSVFAALNLFNNGILAFVFGFCLSAIPTFFILHIILHRGIKHLKSSLMQLACLLVVSNLLFLALCSSSKSYNRKIPSVDQIQSAGVIFSCDLDSKDPKKKLLEFSKTCSEDFTDSEYKNAILEFNTEMLKFNSTKSIPTQFNGFWQTLFRNMLSLDVGDNWYSGDGIVISYKLKDGTTFTRYYEENDNYVNDYNYQSLFNYNPVEKVRSSEFYKNKYMKK